MFAPPHLLTSVWNFSHKFILQLHFIKTETNYNDCREGGWLDQSEGLRDRNRFSAGSNGSRV